MVPSLVSKVARRVPLPDKPLSASSSANLPPVGSPLLCIPASGRARSGIRNRKGRMARSVTIGRLEVQAGSRHGRVAAENVAPIDIERDARSDGQRAGGAEQGVGQERLHVL